MRHFTVVLIDTPRGYDINSCVQYWISHGAPASKLILGIPLYARTFQLASNGNHGIGVPAQGGGNAGPYTRQRGVLGYNEVNNQELIRNLSARIFFGKSQKYDFHISHVSTKESALLTSLTPNVMSICFSCSFVN